MLIYMEEKKASNPLIEKLKRTVGARVAELRQARERAEGKFSQNDLAAALRKTNQKVQQSQIGHIEAGRRLPSMELLYSMAEIFDTSLDFLTGRTELSSSIAAIDEDLQTGGISGRLGEIYKSLPVDKQGEVYQFADALRIIAQRDALTQSPSSQPTENQRRRANVLAILESIERNLGRDMRTEVEKLIRDRGHFGGGDT